MVQWRLQDQGDGTWLLRADGEPTAGRLVGPWALFSLPQGDLVATGQGSLAPRADELSTWQVKAQRIARNAAVAVMRGRVFLRFGWLPQGGRSVNHGTGMVEAGVSVLDVIYDVEADAYHIAPWILPGWLSLAAEGRPAYFVTGDVAGTGSDGETVLKNARVVARARYSEGRGWIPVPQRVVARS